MLVVSVLVKLVHYLLQFNQCLLEKIYVRSNKNFSLYSFTINNLLQVVLCDVSIVQ